MLSILFYVFVGYWVVCSALMLASLLLKCPDETLDRQAELIDSLPAPRRWFAKTFGLVGLAIIAPFLLPHCLLNCYFDYRREVALITRLKRNHRENVFQKLHPMNVPKRARDHFDERAPELSDLGFVEIGRYLLKPEPVPSYGYIFQSPDGATLGVLGSMFDQTYLSFSTTFANGVALETASVEETPHLALANQSQNFRVAFAPGVSIAEAYARHLDEIEAIVREFHTHALSLEPEQFHEVLTYEGRVYSQFLYELGEHDAPPPPAVLPVPGMPAPMSTNSEEVDELEVAALGEDC